MKTIRVGMIRCDVHAAWYGLLFAPANEELMLYHFPQNQYYFYYRHNLKFGLLPGFELTKVYDPFPPHVGMTRAEDDQRSNAEIFSQQRRRSRQLPSHSAMSPSLRHHQRPTTCNERPLHHC